MLIDFSRPPNMRERQVLESRLRRLDLLSPSVAKARAALNRVSVKRSLSPHLLLRPDFVYRVEPAPPASSDRALPAAQHRPPATRLLSPRGAALRFYLTALAEAQIRHGPGARPANVRGLRPRLPGDVGWIDLIASPARSSGHGQTRMGVQDKKLRQLHNALQRLAECELIALPRWDEVSGKYEGFQLHHEGGARALGDPIPYTIPKRHEAVVRLPADFMMNGWVHVLEDTEIVLLLMVAYGRGSLPNEEDVAIPADVRLLHYGIGRDAYEAHVMLSRLGLLEVKTPGRYLDGKVQDFRYGAAPTLHRLRLLRDGFEQDAVATLRRELQYQLGRR